MESLGPKLRTAMLVGCLLVAGVVLAPTVEALDPLDTTDSADGGDSDEEDPVCVDPDADPPVYTGPCT